MALKPCKSCKHQVDTHAKTCPSCGVANPGMTLGQQVAGGVGLLAIIAVAVSMCSGGEEGSTPQGQAISQSEYGEKWPFTVAQGSVRCEGASWVVFEAGGVAYAVNGSARTVAKTYGWAEIDPIWRDDPAAQGTGTTWKVSVSPIIERGLKLCVR